MGATNINKQYEGGSLASISFLIDVSGNTIAFRLPAKVGAVQKVLWAEVKRPRPETEKRINDQAERTAWKIVAEWVEIQFSMIKLEQAEFAEVFLPYAYDYAKDQTFYQRLKESNFKLLSGPK